MSTVLREPKVKRGSAWDQFLQHALQAAGDLTPQARELLRNDLRLQFDFPGKYVAYRDRWKKHGKKATLIRQVLAHGPSPLHLQKVLTTLSGRERAQVMLRYVTDPQCQELQVHYDLPGR